MDKTYDVIVAGAGPVGLLLACELGLAGASVVVLERDGDPSSAWKTNPVGMRGLHLPSIELLYRRGLLGKLYDMAERPHSVPKGPGFTFGGHFAGIPLNLHKLDLSRWKYRLPGPSLMPAPISIDRIEAVLAERAESLGVTILRGHPFGKIVAEDDTGITVETAGNDARTFRGRWLVGCDGGHSAVRKAAGIDFVGTQATLTGYVVHCDLDEPEKLAPGFQPTKAGMYIFRKPDAVYLMDFDGGAGRDAELTPERLQQVMDRVTGKTDVRMKKVHLASAFTDRGKQAKEYRKGRVLLAGDAAHIHPPLGAQGMNTGLGDALNLGWKLAATVRKEKAQGGGSDSALLDTYQRERYPIGEFVLDWNRAQVAALQPNETGYAVMKLMRDLITTTDGANHFIDRVWGLSQRYDLGEGVPDVVGRSAPDIPLSDGTRLGPKMETGRGLLVDFSGDDSLKGLVADGRFKDRVEYVSVDADDKLGIRAMLIRPDGFVAWAVEEGSEADMDACKDALEKWFGF
ncbi:monooxygenase FAD-binding protein [Colletotrichum plurivorum]|uniref:Monooxygenase FAD-binding protein n=1 Tax=Colletotrichum plurivorum TaxID=2175906 RepID=A0A8H6U502_9PEZI|nr:monooxygenase FAD-binding protein [Colletotrichum plurivorum]